MEEQGSTSGQIQRVVFVGAESTGKSTLCEYLARQYGSVAVPEIGRYICPTPGATCSSTRTP